MRKILSLVRHEIGIILSTPVMGVYIYIFLLLGSSFTFYLGGFFQRGQSDLNAYFQYLPWLYTIMIPALTQRVWAEERQLGTKEILQTIPVSLWKITLAKFVTYWFLSFKILLLTTPLWITIVFLGEPDNGAILSGYIGAIFLAGVYIGIGVVCSSLTRNQVIAYVLASLVSFVLTVAGLPIVTEGLSVLFGSETIQSIIELSLLYTFRQLYDGAISIGAILYLVSLIVFCLLLATCILKIDGASRKTKVRLRYRGILIAVGLVVFNVFLSSTSLPVLDFTEEKKHSLSSGSKEVLDRIEGELVLKLYYSEVIDTLSPPLANHSVLVRTVLSRIGQYSGGNIRIEELDPESFSSEEDEAIKHGLSGISLEDGRRIYFGLVVSGGEREEEEKGEEGERGGGEIIEFFQLDRASFLEYDILKAIMGSIGKEKKDIRLISGVEVEGIPSYGSYNALREFISFQQLKELYPYERIFESKELLESPPELLVIYHPGKLEEDMLYAIDQYIVSGGKSIIFVDPAYKGLPNSYGITDDTDSTQVLGKLFNKWGIEVVSGKVVGDEELSVMVNVGTSSEVVPLHYLPWIAFTGASVDSSIPVMSSIERLLLPSAGSIRKLDNFTEGEVVMSSLLATSSASSGLIDSEGVLNESPEVEDILRNFASDELSHNIIVRMSGKVGSTYTEAPALVEEELISDAEGEGESAGEGAEEDVGESAGEGAEEDVDKEEEEKFEPYGYVPEGYTHKSGLEEEMDVVIFADADFLQDHYWVEARNFLGEQMIVPTASNGDLLINMVELMSNSVSLANLRGRSYGIRPFTRIQRIEREAEGKFRLQERQLAQELKEGEEELQELQKDETIEERDKLLEEITSKILEARKGLRQVNHRLREDIEGIQRQVKVLNIVVAPLCVLFIYIVMWWWRSNHRRSWSRFEDRVYSILSMKRLFR